MKGTQGECSRLKVFSLGMAIGIATGLWFLLWGWSGWLMGMGHDVIHLVGSVYKGFAPTLIGGLFGGLWGFIDGFLFGIVIAFIYNQCLKCGVCRDK